jgi:hypothetical protein
VLLASQQQISLLPTPRASEGTKGSPNQHGSRGDLTLTSLVIRLWLMTQESGSTGSSMGQRSDGGNK